MDCLPALLLIRRGRWKGAIWKKWWVMVMVMVIDASLDGSADMEWQLHMEMKWKKKKTLSQFFGVSVLLCDVNCVLSSDQQMAHYIQCVVKLE